MQIAVNHLGRLALAAVLAVAAAHLTPAAAQDNAAKPAEPPKIDPKALAILHAACDTLSSARTLSFTAVDTYQRAARNGQPLFYTIMSDVTLQRPDKLRVIKLGDGVPDEFYYDGKTMAAYVPSADLIAMTEAPPTIDQMLDAAWDIGAIYFPFSDVMVSHPCAVFDKTLTSAFYVGQSVVVGRTTTDMVAVAGDDIQAELWIGADDRLPRMVRVTYPNESAHALYQTDYSNWRLNGPVDAAAFGTSKAQTAKRMAFAPPAVGAPPTATGEKPPATKP